MRFYAEHFDPSTFARPDFEEFIQRLGIQNAQLSALVGRRCDSSAGGRVGSLDGDARTEGVRLAIASNSRLDNIVGLLRANLGPNADSWFDAIVSSDIVKVPKPAPDAYKKVLELLHLPPRDCLAVENTTQRLEASVAAGIPTVDDA